MVFVVLFEDEEFFCIEEFYEVVFNDVLLPKVEFVMFLQRVTFLPSFFATYLPIVSCIILSTSSSKRVFRSAEDSLVSPLNAMVEGMALNGEIKSINRVGSKTWSSIQDAY